MSSLKFIMNCKEFDNFIVGYLDGSLPLGQRLAFKAHLTICGTCRKYLRRYRRTIELARASGKEPTQTSADAPEELIKAILAARKSADQSGG